MATTMTITATWSPSADADSTAAQQFNYSIDGAAQPVIALSGTAATQAVTVPLKTGSVLSVSITASNQFGTSAPLTGTFTQPNVDVPAAPTGLALAETSIQ